MIIEKRVLGVRCLIKFDLDPPARSWNLDSRTKKKGIIKEKYTSGNYVLIIKEESESQSEIISWDLFKEGGNEFFLKENNISCYLSIKGFDKFWHPILSPVGTQWNWRVTYQSAANQGAPIIFVLDRSQKTKMAVGFIDQRVETEIWGSIQNGSPDLLYGADYRFDTITLRFKRPTEGIRIKTTRYTDSLFFSSGLHWFDTMAEYTKIHDKKRKFRTEKPPIYLFDPIWDTWAVGDWIGDYDEKIVFENAKKAAELGFKTIILDAGWASEGRGNWWNHSGDWIPNSMIFSDFPGLVKRLKSLGLRVIPWCSPFIVAKGAKSRDNLQQYLIYTKKRGLLDVLCPRNPFVQEYVPKEMARIVSQYGLDGLKMDFNDWIPVQPCLSNHEHTYETMGIAIDDCMANIRKAVKAVCPGALLEFRQPYANINNRRYANLWRAGDCHPRMDENRQRCVCLRSYSKGLPVETDYIWWHATEDTEFVAKYLSSTILAGVPSIAIDLLRAPKEHLELIKKWLAFYNEHKEDLSQGNFSVVQNDSFFSTTAIQRDKRAYVGFYSVPASRVYLSKEIEEIYLFNCTNEDMLYVVLFNIVGNFKLVSYDPMFSELSKTKVGTQGNRLTLDLRLPQGGIAKLLKLGQK